MRCQPNQVGHLKDERIFALEDFLENRCSIGDVGKSKVSSVEPSPSSTSNTLPKSREQETREKKHFLDAVQEIRVAMVAAVLEYPGGPKQWMIDNPATLRAALVKILQPTTEGGFNQFTTVLLYQDQPGINFAPDGRLSYKNNVVDATPLQSDIVDVLVKETPWKKPLDTSANRLVDDIDKLGS